jgi:hypothetical protein
MPPVAAARDGNNIPAKLAVLNTDSVQGTNLVEIQILGDFGSIEVTENMPISFTMQPVDPKDPNYVNVWLFEGSDGLTYPAVANSDGVLSVKYV